MSTQTDNRRAIAQNIASGHSFRSHCVEFDDPRYGDPIDITYKGKPDPVALGVYIEESLASPDTRVFTATPLGNDKLPTSYIYNEQDNVMIILDANNDGDFGTVYRTDPDSRKFERLHEHAGHPSIKWGPNAVNHALHRFETDIYKRNPKAWATLEKKAAEFKLETVTPSPLAKEQKRATASVAKGEQSDRAKQVEDETPLNPAIIDILSDRENTLGFWADKDARVTHYFNEKNQTVVTLSPGNLSMKRFKTTEEAFNHFSEKFDQSVRSRGTTPELIQGGHKALTEHYQNITGHMPKMCKTMRDVAKQIKRINLACAEDLGTSIQKTMTKARKSDLNHTHEPAF